MGIIVGYISQGTENIDNNLTWITFLCFCYLLLVSSLGHLNILIAFQTILLGSPADIIWPLKSLNIHPALFSEKEEGSRKYRVRLVYLSSIRFFVPQSCTSVHLNVDHSKAKWESSFYILAITYQNLLFLQENAAFMFSVHGVLGLTHSVYGLCCTICRLLRALGSALYFFVDSSNNWNGKGSIQKSVSIFVFYSFLWDILLCCIVAFWNLTISGRGCNILIFMFNQYFVK